MEGGCSELSGGEGCGATSLDGKTRNVRLAGDCGLATYAADGSEVERREELHLDRQTDTAAGHAIENQWERAVWAGRKLAGNAHRGGGAATGIWRESGEG